MVLDNMKFTDKESLTFVPIKLINTFCHFLDVEHPDVDFKCIKAIDIQRNPELRKKYRPYQEQCRNAFIQAGYEPNIEANGYDGFISNIDPEWLFNCVCTFFKPDVILPPMNTWNVHLAIMTLITMIESYRQSGAVVSTSSVTVNSVINLKT